jgi:hypothetical protein
MSEAGADRPRLHGHSTEGFTEATRDAMRKHTHDKKRARFEVVSMEIDAKFDSPGEVDVYRVALSPLD